MPMHQMYGLEVALEQPLGTSRGRRRCQIAAQTYVLAAAKNPGLNASVEVPNELAAFVHTLVIQMWG
jgi:hypothetical protein